MFPLEQAPDPAGQRAARERRSQATHPARAVPEMLATKPGRVWSWGITKLRGPQREVYFDLYVVLDILFPVRRGLDRRSS